MDALNWVVDHADVLAYGAAGAHAIAVAIVNMTPTPKDDIWLGKFYKIVEAFAGILTHTAKQQPGERGL